MASKSRMLLNAALCAGLVSLAAWAPSCSDSPEITAGGGGGIGGLAKKKSDDDDDDDSSSKSGNKNKKTTKSTGEDPGDLADDETLSAEALGALSEDDLESKDIAQPDAGAPAAEPAAPPPPPIKYPTFDFNGKGACTCKGKVHTTFAKIASAINADSLSIDMYFADMQLSGKAKGQDKASAKIKESTGVTTYTRLPVAQLKPLKEAGFEYVGYAVFATQVVKSRQGQTFIFDKPLPVFPWPSLPSKYAALQAAGNSKSWTANVNQVGVRQFPVTVTFTLLEAADTRVVVKLTVDIPDTTYAIYEDFPMARESIYTINPKAQMITRIDNTSLFLGNECDNRQESVKMAYLVCKRNTEGAIDDFPCAQ